MSIPESQLETWSRQGAAATAESTYSSVKRALESYRGWPVGVQYDVYLQGSYRNSTNIRGDSDVDVAAELTSSFLYDLSRLAASEQQRFHAAHPNATYNWSDFRADILEALRAYYGTSAITEGNKAIKVAGNAARLPAHVVPCTTFRKYESFSDPGNPRYVQGIKFWTRRDNREIINFPKLHYDNGVAKNTVARTSGLYKPAVRIFKNARSYMVDNRRISPDLAPSYFTECLLYNAADAACRGSFQRVYTQVIQDIANRRMDYFTCQNEQQQLFGPTPEQCPRQTPSSS